MRFYYQDNSPYPYIAAYSKKYYKCVLDWDGNIWGFRSNTRLGGGDMSIIGKPISKNEIRALFKKIKLESL